MEEEEDEEEEEKDEENVLHNFHDDAKMVPV